MKKKKLIIKKARELRSLARGYGVKLTLPQSIACIRYDVYKAIELGAKMDPIVDWAPCGCNDPQCGSLILKKEIRDKLDL